MSFPTKKINVLAVSYGRNLFKADNPERQRLKRCSEEVGEHHMIVFTHQSDGLRVVEDGNLVLHPTNSRSKLHMLFDAYRLGKQLLQAKTENWVVTTQDPFEAGLVGWWLSRKYSVPLNVQEHGDFYSTPYWRRDHWLNQLRHYLGLFVLRRATTVRVVSHRIKDCLTGFGIAGEKMWQLPVRTDGIGAVSAAPTINLRSHFSDPSVVFLTMGRLVTQKNVQSIIRAFAEVLAEDPKAVLVVVGQGPEESRLKKLVQKLQIDANVLFLPWTDDPASVMQQADIYVHAARWEGWGRALIEAMATGVPVVTTNVGCVGEVCIAGKHGYVVPANSQAALRKKMIALTADPAKRATLGAQAKQDAMTAHQSLTAYAKEWTEILHFTAGRNK